MLFALEIVEPGVDMIEPAPGEKHHQHEGGQSNERVCVPLQRAPEAQQQERGYGAKPQCDRGPHRHRRLSAVGGVAARQWDLYRKSGLHRRRCDQRPRGSEFSGKPTLRGRQARNGNSPGGRRKCGHRRRQESRIIYIDNVVSLEEMSWQYLVRRYPESAVFLEGRFCLFERRGILNATHAPLRVRVAMAV